MKPVKPLPPRLATILPALLALVLLVAAASPASADRYPVQSVATTEVVLEGGAVLPGGDLADDWVTTEKGLGAETGFDLGFRFRYFVGPRLAVCPTFHYEEFGSYVGTGIDEDAVEFDFEVSPSILHYGLDLQYMPWRERDVMLQPFLQGGLGIYRCRYKDQLLGVEDAGYRRSVNALGFSLGVGARVEIFEVSAVYNLVRFEASGIVGPERAELDWDYLVVRAGLVFPND